MISGGNNSNDFLRIHGPNFADFCHFFRRTGVVRRLRPSSTPWLLACLVTQIPTLIHTLWSRSTSPSRTDDCD